MENGRNRADEAESAWVVGDCTVSLWGLSAYERLRRQLVAAGVTDVVPASERDAAGGATLLLRADWLFEQRTINDLLSRAPVIVERDGVAVAAHVPAALADDALACLRRDRDAIPDGVPALTVGDLSPAFNQALLKVQPVNLLPVVEHHRAALERHLFDGAYKGITDLVTKWVWPAPARAVVRLCTRLGVSPNAVTVASVALVLAATWLFWRGDYGFGLILAWLMTFFDTVDGKLARVTVHATKLGHALDKGTDLIHPPIWYVAWGYGLHAHGGPPGDTLISLYLVILAGYVLGRLIEGAFTLFLADFAIFTWRPIDAWLRLIIARRNPNLILLTVAFLMGRPTAGLYAVAVWTVSSTIILAARLAQACVHRLTRGELQSWLQSVGDDESSLSARVFARHRLPEGLSAR